MDNFTRNEAEGQGKIWVMFLCLSLCFFLSPESLEFFLAVSFLFNVSNLLLLLRTETLQCSELRMRSHFLLLFLDLIHKTKLHCFVQLPQQR